jgi:bifunctional non-homologous end joining protein LigD
VSEAITVEVDGRHLKLTNLDKVLYPEHGFTKGEVIDYYARIAPILLPYLAERPLTVKRYPDGVNKQFFFEKNAARGTPAWVRTVVLPAPGSTKNRETVNYIVVHSVADLVRLANLAALELHVPQWWVSGEDEPQTPDLLVFDLDPGAPAAIAECCEVALLVQAAAAEDGVTLFPKTSGSKGMQLSGPIAVDDVQTPSRYARALAQRLEKTHPKLVVSSMSKDLRRGKVLIDWSQNNPAKTTVAAYSLRARDEPTVSTPLTWDEVATGGALRFTATDVLARVDSRGDLWAGVLDDSLRAVLPALA